MKVEYEQEMFALADCMGWDIQHYRRHRLERSHLVALLLHVHRGASEGAYTHAQADAVLQRLIRSAPTILEAVDVVLAGGQVAAPDDGTGHEDTTETRKQSAAAGVRATRSKYGDDYRKIPWPQDTAAKGVL